MPEPNAPQQPPPKGTDATVPSPPNGIRRVRSDQLLSGGRELQIVHGEEVYRLTLTRNNKLILQK